MSKKSPAKSALASINGGEANYNERAVTQRRAATVASLGRFVGHVKNSREAALESVHQGKRAINEMYQAGREWRVAGDKNQFDMFFYDQAGTLVRPEDREYITTAIVKTALHLAGTLAAPVKTEAEAAQHIQKVLWALDITEKPERITAGSGGTTNWGELIPVETAKYTSFLTNLFASEPVAAWQPDREDTFLAQTEFIAQKRDEVKANKAARLLKQKESGE